MTEPSPTTPGTAPFTVVAGDDTLACTDESCLLPGTPGAATVAQATPQRSAEVPF